jgi:putative DNA primase/helicase
LPGPEKIAKGRITLAVGMPGVGKSFLTCDMASRISTGSPWPDGSVCPKGSVIIISAEDDPHDTIRPRLDAHRADVSRVHLLSSVIRAGDDGEETELMFSLGDLDALETALKQVNNCQLIVVDPIGSFLGGRTDAHRDNEVRSVLAPVAKLAEKYGPAVLMVAHRRKGGGGNADDLALGSRAFTGIARSVWHLSADPEDKQRRLFLPGKNNLAEQQQGLAFTIGGEPASVHWERDPVAMSADEALARENGDKGHSTALDEAVAWLSDALADGPRPGKEVKGEATADGIAPRTLDRAKVKLGVDTGPDGFRGPWVWLLPDSDSVRQDFPEFAKENTLAQCGDTGALCNEHPPEAGELEDDGTVPF